VRLYDEGRLRTRLQRDAAGIRNSLAHSDYARCTARISRNRLLPDAAKIALRDPEGVMLGPVARGRSVENLIAARKRRRYSIPPVPPIRASTMCLNNRIHGTSEADLRGVQRPSSYDFKTLRLSPAELRQQFARQGWRPDCGLPDPQSHASGPCRT